MVKYIRLFIHVMCLQSSFCWVHPFSKTFLHVIDIFLNFLIAYIVKNLIFHGSFFWSCKFDVLWYFHQLRSCRMGAFVMNYVNTAHDAVKYCTNTPKEYKSPWIKCLFIYVFLGMYWELHGLGSSRMGPCRRISIMLWNSVQIPQNGMTDTKYFLALIIFCQKYNVFLSNTKWFNIFFIYSIGNFISSDQVSVCQKIL